MYLQKTLTLSTMIKHLVFGAAAGALALAPLSATAGPFVNVENNGSYVDGFQGLSLIHI